VYSLCKKTTFGSTNEMILSTNMIGLKKKLLVQYARSEKKSTTGNMNITMAAYFLSLACITVKIKTKKRPPTKMLRSLNSNKRLKPSHFADPANTLYDGYGHVLQCFAPKLSLNVPLSHGMHDDDPRPEENDPGGHSPHLPGDPKEPSPHVGCDVGMDVGYGECSTTVRREVASGVAAATATAARPDDDERSWAVRGDTPPDGAAVAVPIFELKSE